jgi:hypothetical protein
MRGDRGVHVSLSVAATAGNVPGRRRVQHQDTAGSHAKHLTALEMYRAAVAAYRIRR